MSTLKNKSKSELIEEIELLKKQAQDFKKIKEDRKQAEKALRESEQRYRSLFEYFPIPLWEQDYTEIIKHLEDLKKSGVSDFEEYFTKYPEELFKCADLIKMTNVNNEAVRLFKAGSKEELMETIGNVFTEETIPVFKNSLLSIAERKQSFESEVVFQTLEKERLACILRWSLLGAKVVTSTQDITERKLVEKVLYESDEKFRVLYNNSPDMYVSVSPDDASILLCNETLLNETGYSREEIIGAQIFKVYHEDCLEDVKNVFKQFVETGEIKDKELILKRKDGSKIDVSLNVDSVKNEAGSILYSISSWRDITKRKMVEKVLYESEEKFSKTFNSSPNPMIITEIESGKVIDINHSFEKLIMYSKQEIIGKSVFELNLWGNIEERENYIKKMKEDKRVSNLEIKIRTKSGDIRDSLISGEILTIQGKTYLLTSGIDITERKLAEDALKEQLYLNQQILETTLDGYILADSDGKIIDVNPAYCDMIGYTWEELLDMNIREVEVKTPPEEVDRRIKQMIRMGGDRFETQHKHKDGRILELDTSTSIMYIDETPMVAAFMRGITERKQAEEALIESNQMLSHVLNTIPVRVFWKDLNGVYLGCDQLFALDAGRSNPEEVIGDNDYNMGWAEQAELYRSDDKFVIESGQPKINYEEPQTTPEGKTIWLRTSKIPLLNRTGNIYGVLGTYEDITERKQAEELIKENERRLATLMSNLPGMAYKCKNDPNWTMEFISDGGYSLTGYHAKELVGSTQVSYADIIHPEDRQMVWENVQDALEKKQPFQLTYRITTASGNEKWVWEQGQAIYGEENDVISLEGFITDITEGKKAEKRIEFLRFITEQVTDSIISTDLDFKINWVNHAFINLYGYSSKEVLNRTPDFLNAEPLSEKIQSEIFNAVLSGNTWKGELINRKKNGSTFLCELLVYPLRDKNGNIFAFAGHQRDITERKNAERKLRDSRNQLRSLAERLQMIREEERATVAREIHDDLGQTLTALKMDIAWMKKNAGMTEEMRAAKFDTMLGLTDSSIQTVKRIATELRPGILDDLGLISAIEWEAEEFQKRSGIECNLVISVEELAVDENFKIAVFRIFQESLTNIARHSGATKIEVTIKKAGDLLQMEITDNGVGISEEQISSSKSLGLIGMNERASVFRGKLTISRAAEGGTAVRVYIPMGKT